MARLKDEKVEDRSLTTLRVKITFTPGGEINAILFLFPFPFLVPFRITMRPLNGTDLHLDKDFLILAA